MHLHDWQAFVNKTSRNMGAVGKNAIVPRIADVLLKHNVSLRTKVLDFGAGKDIAHTKWLRKRGWHIDACEVGHNHTEGIHSAPTIAHHYDLVFASNVLNVQPDLEWLKHTVFMLAYYTRGVMVCNYPDDPRHSSCKPSDVLWLLEHRFDIVEHIYGTPNRPVWLCVR